MKLLRWLVTGAIVKKAFTSMENYDYSPIINSTDKLIVAYCKSCHNEVKLHPQDVVAKEN